MLEFTGERIVPQADNCEPNFASRMYHEHLARYLFAGQLVQGKAVLDVGCGVGYGSQRLAQMGAKSVTAFDISADAVAHAQAFYAHPALTYTVADAEAFDLGRKFDVVTCFEMIEHVKHPNRVLACIARHLADGGIVVASTPRFLGEKRTHFHEREFTFEEYAALVADVFPNTRMYSENNHFASVVTDDAPGAITCIATIKDQFTIAQADVFISVSCADNAALQPVMQPSLVLDDDNYVRMLERDVAILHRAEDDLRASLAAIRAEGDAAIAFRDAEIARLVSEYNALFARIDEVSATRTEAVRAEADAALAYKDAEIARLVGEYNALFERAEASAESRAEAVRAEADGVIAFKDAEIARLVGEYDVLFARAEASAEGRAEAARAEADRVIAFKDAEIARLVGEYNALFERAETSAESRAEAVRAEADRVIAFKDAEIARLVGEYDALFARTEASAESRAEAVRGEAEGVIAFKDAEIARLVREYNALFEAAASASTNEARHMAERQALLAERDGLHADAAALRAQVTLLSKTNRTLEANAASIVQKLGLLTEDRDALKLAYEAATCRLEEVEMVVAELQGDRKNLQREVQSLTVRVNDADARRLEAFEFARSCSEAATSVRRELEILRRDLAEALDSPETFAGAYRYDPKHRAIVESMEKLFLGTQATHHIARDRLVARVAEGLLEHRSRLDQANATIAALQHELDEQRTRADRAEAFAGDWHGQILRLRHSFSWKITRPLRAIGRMFR